MPLLGWFRRWVGMDALVRGADLEQLPAVCVAVEQAGGFRDDVVTWATLPAASRPRLTLWKGLWFLGAVPFYLLLLAVLFVSGGHHLLDTVVVAAFLLPMLSGRMLVSGVTASVEELARRYEHQRATGAGTEPATRSTLR